MWFITIVVVGFVTLIFSMRALSYRKAKYEKIRKPTSPTTPVNPSPSAESVVVSAEKGWKSKFAGGVKVLFSAGLIILLVFLVFAVIGLSQALIDKEEVLVETKARIPDDHFLIVLPEDGSFSEPLPLPSFDANLEWSKNVDVLVRVPGRKEIIPVKYGEQFNEGLSKEEQALSFALLKPGQYGRVTVRWIPLN